MTAGLWPIAIRPLGPASCGAVLWRFRGRLQLTAVVKGVFAIAPEGRMWLVAPEALHLDDVPHQDDPRRSARAPGDLAPYRGKADVVLTGSVYAAEEGAQALDVRLAVLRDQKVLVDKSIHVLGDRALTASAAQRFAQMPLTYERALGGPGSGDNPVGTGLAPGSAPPNLVDRSNPQRTVGFGPVARAWPARARLLGSLDPGALAKRPIELPTDFDWAYFQDAPLDQQCDHLRGDELILLENVYAAHPALRLRLPRAKAVGKLHGFPGEAKGRALAFRADGLHLDTERGRCAITWRAGVPVLDESDLGRLELVAGIEVDGNALIFPGAEPASTPSFEGTMSIDASDLIEDPPVPDPAPATPSEGSSSAGLNLLLAAPPEGTADLSSVLARGPALPFGSRRVSVAAAPPITVAAPAPSIAAQAAAIGALLRAKTGRDSPLEATLELSDRGGEAPSLPFTQAASAAATPAAATPEPPARPAGRAAPRSFDETITVVEGSIPSLKAPFVVARPGEAHPVSAPAIPGAPWSAVAVVAPRVAPGSLDVTADLSTTLAAEAQGPAPIEPDRPSVSSETVDEPMVPTEAARAEPVAEGPAARLPEAEQPAAPRSIEAAPPPTPPAVETPSGPLPGTEATKPAWSWAKPDPAEAARLHAVAQPSPAPPQPQLTDGLYRGFTKKKT